MKQYKKKHAQEIMEYNKKYKAEHADEIKNYNARYNLANRQIIQKRHTVYLNNKRKTDVQYKLSTSMRTRINKVINGQKKKKH